MTMIYSYIQIPQHQGIVALGGRFVRPRTIIPFSVGGPLGFLPLDGVLDTGADEVLFHESVAVRIGVDLSNAPTGLVTGVGSSSVPVRFAEVTLLLYNPHEQREWSAWAAFTAARLQRPLLGFAGLLRFFTAIFRGDVEKVELEVNSLYPGT